MADFANRPYGSLLLSVLPPAQQSAILARSERVELASGNVVAIAEQPIQHVYFPISAVLSVLSVLADRSGIESAVIGRYGIAPLAAFHGVFASPEQIIVQVPGEALKMAVGDFRALLEASPELRAVLHRFAQALFTLTAQSSACNRRHTVVQRCARWLLMTHDRVPGDEFPITHLFLSQMLGVRRSSVTIAAETLRSVGAIDYTRAKVRVSSRELLQGQACECYAIVRAAYDRLLWNQASRSPIADLELAHGERSLLIGSDDQYRDSPASGISLAGQLGERRAEEQEAVAGEAATGGAFVARLDKALDHMEDGEANLRHQLEGLESLRRDLERRELAWHEHFDELSDAYFETDDKDVIVAVNRAAEELLQQTRDALIGTVVHSLVTPAERRSLRSVMAALHGGDSRARWSGTLIRGSDPGHGVEMSIAVTRDYAQPGQGYAIAWARREGGKYVGARFLVRSRIATPEGPVALPEQHRPHLRPTEPRPRSTLA